jgi:hypothetical protein
VSDGGNPPQPPEAHEKSPTPTGVPMPPADRLEPAASEPPDGSSIEPSGPGATADSPLPGAGVPPVPPSGTDIETQLRLSGVFLLTEGPDGPTAVPGLTLELTRAGLSIAKMDKTPVWSASWEDVEELATPERSRLPDGSSGVVLTVETSRGRVHRFVLPSQDPDGLEAALETLADQMGISPVRRPRHHSPVLAILALLATAAAVTVLLLAAGHVIHL